ncbi:MAG TPA: polysaccharide biosynthesis tyrosine autokinase [Methylocystis sp.]|nr:polysaccharide biosynthesis tyrosine autokinase [Methylocystis sp.]
MHKTVPFVNLQSTENRDSTEAVDLRQLQDFVWRRWKFILLVTFVVMVAALVVMLMIAPRYTATAMVLLEPRKEKIFGSDTVLPELNLETSNIESQLSVLQSTNLLRRVVEKEKLEDDAEFGGQSKEGFLDYVLGLLRSPWRGESEDLGKADEQMSPETLKAVGRLRKALDVVRVNRTYVLSISVTSLEPGKAARLANAVADAYVVDQLEARYDAAKRASVWFSERLGALQEQLRQSEDAVAEFRKEHGLLATGSGDNRVMISEQQLSDLNTRLIEARADVAEKRARYEQAARVTAHGGNMQAIPDVVRSNVITELRRQQAEVTRKLADLGAHYGGQHPLVINAQAERRDIERAITAEVQRILLNLKNDYEVSKSRENSLRDSLDKVTGQTGQENGLAVRLRELERVNAANKALYDNFMARARITQEQSTLEEREARLISPATRPNVPSFPQKTPGEIVAAIVGLLLGVAGAVALDMLNSGFMSARQLEERLGYPVLASVPLLPAKDRKVENKLLDPARYLMAKPLSRYAEVVRAVRVGIQMADVDNPAKVILITSSVPNEGKSTLAQSIAYSAARAGQKVLIVDGDLRHCSTSKFFGLENAKGLVDMLTGETELERAISVHDGVFVLPAGAKSQNPPDLLGSDRMKAFVEHLRSEFDYIVFDSPPVEPVIDAKVMVGFVDKVIFNVRWKSTKRECAADNVDHFALSQKLAGVVLSLVDETKTPRYGHYGQYYGYGYYKNYYAR